MYYAVACSCFLVAFRTRRARDAWCAEMPWLRRPIVSRQTRQLRCRMVSYDELRRADAANNGGEK